MYMGALLRHSAIMIFLPLILGMITFSNSAPYEKLLGCNATSSDELTLGLSLKPVYAQSQNDAIRGDCSVKSFPKFPITVKPVYISPNYFEPNFKECSALIFRSGAEAQACVDANNAEAERVSRINGAELQRVIRHNLAEPERVSGERARLQEQMESIKEILEKSRSTVSTHAGDNAYWFARLYEIITYDEISSAGNFRYPSFVMHFIPIFYNMYYDKLQHYLNGEYDKVDPHWMEHFNIASGIPWNEKNEGFGYFHPYNSYRINNILESAVKAHIQRDMSLALEQAYKSYVAKYGKANVPPFDQLKSDFFDVNWNIFEGVKNHLLCQFSYDLNMSIDWLRRGDKWIGLSTVEIFQWREEAWNKAADNLRKSPP
jgi:hypothetical protein